MMRLAIHTGNVAWLLAAAAPLSIAVAAYAAATSSGPYIVIEEVKDDVGMVLSKHVDYVSHDPALTAKDKSRLVGEAEHFWIVYLNDGAGGLVHKREWVSHLFPILDRHDAYVVGDAALHPVARAEHLDRSQALRAMAQPGP